MRPVQRVRVAIGQRATVSRQGVQRAGATLLERVLVDEAGRSAAPV